MKYHRQAIRLSSLRTTAVFLAAACAWGQTSDEEARLAQLIEPRDAQAAGLAQLAEEEFETMVRALFISGEWEAITALGESAGPVLSTIASELTLMELLSPTGSNPMPLLNRSAPLAALEFHDKVSRTDPMKFEALTRSSLSFTALLDEANVSRGLGEGAPREMLLGLLDQSIRNGKLTLDMRLEMALKGARVGYVAPSSRALIEQNMELAVQRGNIGTLLEILVPEGEPVPITVPLPLVIEVIQNHYTSEVIQRFASSPHADVREEIARVIARFVRTERQEAEDGIVAVLVRLGTDEVLAVRDAACDSTVEILSDNGVRISPAHVTELALVALRTGVADRRNRSGMLQAALMDRWRSRQDFTREHVRAVVAFVASMESPAVRASWSQARFHFRSATEAAFGALDGAEGGPADLYQQVEEGVMESLGNGLTTTASNADGRLEFLMRAGGDPAEESRRVEGLLKVWERAAQVKAPGAKYALLESLSPERVPAAIAWLASTETVLGEHTQDNLTKWTEAAAPMRRVFEHTSRSWDERAIAAAGLLNIGKSSPADRATMAKLLLAKAQEEGGVQRVAEFFSQVATDRRSGARLQWSALSADLLENTAFPDEAATEVTLLVKGETAEELEVVQRVLDAVNGRLLASGGSLKFRNVKYYGLEAMAMHPSMVRNRLLSDWVVDGGSLGESMIRAAIASKDADILHRMQGRLESALRSGGYSQQLQRIADLMLMLPGDEPVEALLEIALQSDQASFTDHVDELVSKRMRLRKAAAEWGQLSEMVSTKEASIARLIKLLDAPNKDVRLAAIEGLGTMGAVVAVPDLVELVASDDDAVKAAALDALERMKQTKED